ncbi:MAG TPA: PDZ domain-containing protein [Polyangiaceae bacterium]|nr:PDZ domain-containing protein [Polyangiaceae bacterium]
MALIVGTGCAAVYPELQAPVRASTGRELDAPSSGVKWIAFKSASVPQETRDGRKWGGDLGRGTPDPYAVLFVNGKLLLKTPVQSGTLAPTWPDGPAGNFRIKNTDRFRVELWDSKAINDHPIGVKEIGTIDEESVQSGEVEVECDSGAKVRIAFEPAHARLGLGFYYELRIGEAFVTRLYDESPAGRGGLKPGDQIVWLDGKPVSGMKSAEVTSIINTPHMNGLAMKIRRAGQESAITLKDGAIYPLFSEMGSLR